MSRRYFNCRFEGTFASMREFFVERVKYEGTRRLANNLPGESFESNLKFTDLRSSRVKRRASVRFVRVSRTRSRILRRRATLKRWRMSVAGKRRFYSLAPTVRNVDVPRRIIFFRRTTRSGTVRAFLFLFGPVSIQSGERRTRFIRE